jgi:hypothetical protein
MTDTEKVREDRVRRMFARQGFRIAKSYRRDPRAWDYGLYLATWLLPGDVDSCRVARLFESLDEAERWAVNEDLDLGHELRAVSRRPASDWQNIGTITISAAWGDALGVPEHGPETLKVFRDRNGRFLYIYADAP